jgi:hypothetical protein
MDQLEDAQPLEYPTDSSLNVANVQLPGLLVGPQRMPTFTQSRPPSGEISPGVALTLTPEQPAISSAQPLAESLEEVASSHNEQPSIQPQATRLTEQARQDIPANMHLQTGEMDLEPTASVRPSSNHIAVVSNEQPNRPLEQAIMPPQHYLQRTVERVIDREVTHSQSRPVMRSTAPAAHELEDNWGANEPYSETTLIHSDATAPKVDQGSGQSRSKQNQHDGIFESPSHVAAQSQPQPQVQLRHLSNLQPQTQVDAQSPPQPQSPPQLQPQPQVQLRYPSERPQLQSPAMRRPVRFAVNEFQSAELPESSMRSRSMVEDSPPESPPASSPMIHVTIGRIEVRAVSPPEHKAFHGRPAQPQLNLEEYLRQRREGHRG